MPLHEAHRKSLPISDEELEDANRYQHLNDRRSRIIAHALKRKVLASLLGLDPLDLHFERDKYGKPHLLNDQVSFSVTHTQHQVAVAATARHNCATGLDVESYDYIGYNEAVSMARMILNPEEFGLMQEHSDLRSCLIQCWTAKEAVLKAIGKGMQQGPLTLLIKNEKIDDDCRGYHVSIYRSSRIGWMSLAQPNAEVGSSQMGLKCKAFFLKDIDSFNTLGKSGNTEILMPVRYMYIYQRGQVSHCGSQG